MNQINSAVAVYRGRIALSPSHALDQQAICASMRSRAVPVREIPGQNQQLMSFTNNIYICAYIYVNTYMYIIHITKCIYVCRSAPCVARVQVPTRPIPDQHHMPVRHIPDHVRYLSDTSSTSHAKHHGLMRLRSALWRDCDLCQITINIS
jgi:hypothetical protein